MLLISHSCQSLIDSLILLIVFLVEAAVVVVVVGVVGVDVIGDVGVVDGDTEEVAGVVVGVSVDGVVEAVFR